MVLQNPGAAMVMQACIPRACSAKCISETTGVPVVTVYRHVKQLLALKLLVVERSAMTETGKPYDLYKCPLEWARLTVSAEGINVQWQARRSTGDRLHDLWKQLEDRT